MKKILFLSVLMSFSVLMINAQPPATSPAPSTPSSPKLRDENLKMRSVDLERTKRDAEKADSDVPAINSEIDKKFPEIKEDFEGMQMAQAEIVKAYSNAESIDYSTIKKSAGQINKNAKRLGENLFEGDLKTDKKDKDEDKSDSKTVRELIVELDNAIGSFTTSTMFQNLRAVEAEVAIKTQGDLIDIVRLSDDLSKVAGKMK